LFLTTYVTFTTDTSYPYLAFYYTVRVTSWIICECFIFILNFL